MIVWIHIDHYFLVKYHNTCVHNHQPGELDMRRFEPLPDVECKELYLQMPSSNLSQMEEVLAHRLRTGIVMISTKTECHIMTHVI